jgi:hypothetical protein
MSDLRVILPGYRRISKRSTRTTAESASAWLVKSSSLQKPPKLSSLRLRQHTLRMMGACCVTYGGWNHPEVVGWEDARLLQAIRAGLRLAMKIEAAPLFHHIVRWDRAIPQYHLGHLERVAAIKQRIARHPGLFVGGNAYHGVAVNDCTEQAEVLAVQVRNYLTSRAS